MKTSGFGTLGALAVGLAALVSNGAAPTIQVAREGSQTRIGFTGTLEAAATVTGPWIEITNAPNPYVTSGAGARFFRTREAGGIFAAQSVADLTVIGPLQMHFEKAFAGMPDGIFPPVREKAYFEGRIQIGGREIPADLRVRGNSSLQECPFPKLKFKVSRSDRAGTPFADAREVKIGTHCAEGGRGPIGRLREEIATYREALAYETMSTLGFVSPRVRRARITYLDTTPTNGVSEVGWEVTRSALLLDDAEVIGERLGGMALKDEEVAALENGNFSTQLLTDLHLMHGLLGNWDYTLGQAGRDLWNTDVIRLPDGSYVPVAGDFDLASFVTERVQMNAPWDYHPELPDLERQMLFKLDSIRQQFGAESFAAGIARFTEKRAAMEAVIAGALVDETGRTNAAQHVTAFFEAAAALGGKR